MTKQNFTQKSNGDTLSASEWNNLTSYVNTAVDAINAGGGGATIDSSGVLSVSSKGNVTVGSNKNINLEPAWDNNVANYVGNYGDVAIKSGDDIQFCSHHREPKKRDKVVVKAIDGSDNPVKMELGCGEIAISTKGKAATLKKNKTTGADVANDYMFKPSEAGVMDVKILTGNTLDEGTADERDERGYLKVRAQAIDLRCEKHGGVALQPKGYDGDGNMNKIKFEHGGGDGLEFGTFNTEKTSIFTDEYRFNREGVWKMATRQTTPNSKAIYDDNTPLGKTSTAALQYVKQADDFYDIIAQDDEQCTTKDIIKTAYAMNGGKDRHTKITNKGAIEIATNVTWTIHIDSDNGSSVNVNTISDEIAALESVSEGMTFNEGDFKVGATEYTPDTTAVYTNGTQYFSFTEVAAPSIKIESGAELKLGGILDFGSSFNFGETDNGIEVQYKLTKKNNTKDCGVLKVVGVNNHETNNLVVEGVTIAPGETATIAQCSLLDMIKLVNYMKTNNQGPWAGTNS